MKFIFKILLIVVLISQLNCAGSKYCVRSNDFYCSTGGFDYARIPGKEPYEFLSIAGNDTAWFLERKGIPIISEVTHFNISGNYIIGRTKSFKVFESTIPESWFYVNMKNEKLFKYNTAEELKIELEKFGLEKIVMINADIHSAHFRKHGKLHWFGE